MVELRERGNMPSGASGVTGIPTWVPLRGLHGACSCQHPKQLVRSCTHLPIPGLAVERGAYSCRHPKQLARSHPRSLTCCFLQEAEHSGPNEQGTPIASPMKGSRKTPTSWVLPETPLWVVPDNHKLPKDLKCQKAAIVSPRLYALREPIAGHVVSSPWNKGSHRPWINNSRFPSCLLCLRSCKQQPASSAWLQRCPCYRMKPDWLSGMSQLREGVAFLLLSLLSDTMCLVRSPLSQASLLPGESLGMNWMNSNGNLCTSQIVLPLSRVRELSGNCHFLSLKQDILDKRQAARASTLGQTSGSYFSTGCLGQ